MLFPLDIISQIVKYLPVADATKTIVALCPGIETESLQQIKNEQRDPNVFFWDIVSEVPLFMELMKMTRTMLIGIRAFSYFHHVNIKSSHPWEFMCRGDILCWMPFVDHLAKQGMEWGPIKQSSDTSSLSTKTSSILGWIFSNGKRVPIRLTWLVAERLPMETIIDAFGMTPLQCVITGHEAIDPYGELHSRRKYRLWEEERYNNSEHFPDVFEAMNMCHNASIEPIGHDAHRKYDPYRRFKKYCAVYNGFDSMIIHFGAHTRLPQPMFERTSVNIPIAYMVWEEDAYRVKASSYKMIKKFSYDEIRSKWSHISLPSIEHEHTRYLNDLGPSESPSWTTNEQWKIFVSEMFNREIEDDESEDSQW
jgi:hypothetical protein